MYANQHSGTQKGLLFRILLFVLTATLLLSACGSAEGKWQSQYDLGIRYLEEGKIEDAILAFTAAIEIDPKQAAAYIGRGDAFIQLAKEAAGDITDPAQLPDKVKEAYENAIADYKEAISLDATDADCYRSAAEAYLALGQEEEAAAILNEGHGATGDEELLTMAQGIQGAEEPGQAEQSPEDNPEQAPEENPEENAGQTPEQSAEENPEQSPEENSEQTPEQDAEQTPEQDAEQTPEQAPEQTPEQAPEQTPAPEEPEQQPAPEPVQPTAADPATAYTSFLNNGGWAQALGADEANSLMSGNPTVESCLADLDGDGVKELFLNVAEDEYGMLFDVAVLDMEGGNVVVRKSGQTMYGNRDSDCLFLRYDTQDQKPVLVHEWNEDLGMQSGGDEYLVVYDSSMQNEVYNIQQKRYTYFDPSNEERIAKIKSETTVYEDDGDMIWAYQLNGQYITEEEYNAWMARFQEPTDPAYQLKTASMSQPIAP